MEHGVVVILSGADVQGIAILGFVSMGKAEAWLRKHGFVHVRHGVWNCESPATLDLPGRKTVADQKFQAYIEEILTVAEITFMPA